MRERWRSATDTAWYELSPASPERLGEAAWSCSGLSLNGRNCVRTHAHARRTSATRTPTEHRDRPVRGIHNDKYQTLNELTSENQIHSPPTSGRAQLRARPRRRPNWRIWQLGPARARALGAGCVRFTVRGLGSAWSGHAAVRAPTRCFRRQAHGHGGHARRRARARSRSHDTELHSCQCHRHETHTVHIQYTRHSSVLCAACQTQRGHLVHASSSARKSWPAMAPPEGWPQTRTNAAACTVEDGCYGC